MIELLRRCNILAEMDESKLRQIAEACTLRRFKKGDRVFNAGDPAELLFIVNEGKVELRFRVSYLNVSTDISLENVSSGEAFGWSALTPPFRYTLSAFVTEDAELVEIRERDIKRICQTDNRLGYILMSNIATVIGRRFSILQEILIREIQRTLKEKESFL